MAKTDWKPTKEMVKLAGMKMSNAENDHPRSHYELAKIALIAVQPLIAAQALEKAKVVVTEFLACDDLSQREGCNPARLKKAYADLRAMIGKEPQG